MRVFDSKLGTRLTVAYISEHATLMHKGLIFRLTKAQSFLQECHIAEQILNEDDFDLWLSDTCEAIIYALTIPENRKNTKPITPIFEKR